jgi:hypothetical protein
MSFSQAAITSVSYTEQLGELAITWTSTAPPNTWYQIYVDGQLVDRGKSLSAVIPAPTEGAQIVIGTVDAADSMTNFSSSLPASPATRAELSWTGGMFLDSLGTVAGFNVYGVTSLTGFGLGGFGAGGYGSPGGFGTGGFGVGGFGIGDEALNLTPLATIPAYTNGVVTSGFGMGGFGAGGFGSASASYSWTSDALPSGTWTFAVAAFDQAGNIGALQSTSVTIAAPPSEPPAFADGSRLDYILAGFGAPPFGAGGFGQSVVQLSWNPSE